MRWRKKIVEKTVPEDVPGFYGGNMTWHQEPDWVDVVTKGGVVTEVWFRCAQVKFQQSSQGGRLRREGKVGRPIEGIVFRVESPEEETERTGIKYGMQPWYEIEE